MDHPKKQSKHTQRRRQALIGAALQLLRQTSIDRISVNAVAKLVGVSTSVVYWHFGTRQGLLDAVVASELGLSLTEITARLERAVSAEEAVADTMQGLATGLLAVADSCGSSSLLLEVVEVQLPVVADLLQQSLSAFQVSGASRLAIMASVWAHGLALSTAYSCVPMTPDMILLEARNAANFLLDGHRHLQSSDGALASPTTL